MNIHMCAFLCVCAYVLVDLGVSSLFCDAFLSFFVLVFCVLFVVLGCFVVLSSFLCQCVEVCTCRQSSPATFVWICAALLVGCASASVDCLHPVLGPHQPHL